MSSIDGFSHVDRLVESAKPSKSDVNSVIMDYLINEGYPDAAQRFSQEAGVQLSPGAESIQQRVSIRNAIHAGDIQSAIEQLNELDPEILDTRPTLHFSLLRLQLIELIRGTVNSSSTPSATSFTPALEFATSQLAPRAPTSPAFLQDLERTMALLIFPPDKLTPQLKSLLDLDLRQTIASHVNESILAFQGQQREARLRGLVRLRKWSEQTAKDANMDIPANLTPSLLDLQPVMKTDDDAMVFVA